MPRLLRRIWWKWRIAREPIPLMRAKLATLYIRERIDGKA
jgi:hypothetical protein